jgi:hypothetical protein
MSRVRRYSRSSRTHPHGSSPTGLSPAPAGRSRTVPLTRVDRARDQSLSPAITFYPLKTAPTGSYALRVWAPPVSLAATPGILSVPRGTEMFQFPRCPLRIRAVTAHHGRRVAPFGDRGITGCQPLPRAFRCVAASFLGCRRQGIHRPPINAELLSLRQTRLRPPRGPPPCYQVRWPAPGHVTHVHLVLFRFSALDCVSVCATHDASLLRSHRSSRHAGAHRGIGLPEGQGARMNCQSAVKSWTASGRCGGGFPLTPVEPRGLEPRTSAVQRRRSPS